MRKTALVTGGYGFLGRAVARRFRARGYRIVGIGRGAWTAGEALAHGFDTWVPSDITQAALGALDERYELVVHCAGAGSVGYSLTNPHEAFQKTVAGTAELLEHLRLTGSTALLIYPSSAAVYGAADDRPLAEDDAPNPVSPYGDHKKITEELIGSYARHFGTRAAIIRYFSIYGPGLAKQLLWDAAGKLSSSAREVTFWGTGEETRDWIHVDDATALMVKLAEGDAAFTVVNGGAGQRITASTVLHKLRDALGADVDIRFNGNVRPGDPRFYLADTSKLRQIGFEPAISLDEGLAEYARWFRTP
ncbi:NAD-dependent epimerase/dehydratase family protein [Ramlibacter sp.]|uniref:NAD-dependent epimerase/dehydratase family protein n=1 Tax=Ramlibacter sp. TaxID=1917967 RepID=UPI003D101F8A